MATADPTAGVYIHLPFCARICPYCDFAVRRADSDLERRLLDALEVEMAGQAAGFRQPVDTIYLGGGTPSLTAPERLERLIERLEATFAIETGRQLVIEVNPEDVSAARLAEWKALGVTTVSLGVQSLEPEALRFLGRSHSTDEARRAIELALEGDFETVSVDLIYARPGQTPAEWRHELEAVAALGPDHLSCYQLTVHPRTPFGRAATRGRLVPMPDEEQAELFLATHHLLPRLGWDAYEVSNFARAPEHRSRHNLKYWRGAPYVGLGPSAHSFDSPRRWWNVPAVEEYLARLQAGRSPVADRETLAPETLLLEALMLGLRTAEGVDLERLGERFERELVAPNRRLLELWEERGQVRCQGGRVVPAPEGWVLADRLAVELDLSVTRDRASD